MSSWKGRCHPTVYCGKSQSGATASTRSLLSDDGQHQRHIGACPYMAAWLPWGQKPLGAGPTTTLALPLGPACPHNPVITYIPSCTQLQTCIFHKCFANVTPVFYTFQSLIKLMYFPFGQIVITSESLWLGFEVNVLWDDGESSHFYCFQPLWLQTR